MDVPMSKVRSPTPNDYGRWLQGRLLVWAILLAGCAGLGPPSREMVLARVNGEAVTVEDLEQAFTQSHRGHGILLAGKGAVRQFLEKVVDTRLLLQEARRIGLDQDPDIQKAVEELKGKRVAEAFYRDEVRRSVLVPEEAIAASYEALRHRFQARHILVTSRQEVESALERINAGEEFGEVAHQVSQTPTASRGGDLGIVRWGQIDPKLEERLWTLEKGQVSEPFESEDGWNLLYVIERVPVDRPELEDARPYIRGVLARRETKRHADALFHDLMARWNGVVNETALRVALKAREGADVPVTTVVAEAADQKITLGQFLRRVNLDRARQLPHAKAWQQMRRLVEDELFRILLRKEGLAREYGDRADITTELERLRGNLAVDHLLNRVVFARLQVSDEGAQGYYQAHSKEFTEPEAAKISVILLETEEEARAVMAELQDGQELASLARTESKDRASAQLGGEMGWVRKGQVHPGIETVAFSLRAGGLGIAGTQAGYYVIRVEERKEARLKPFGEVREQARQKALRRKSQETLKRWITMLREASVIQIDDEAISRAIATYEETFRQKAAGSWGETRNP